MFPRDDNNVSQRQLKWVQQNTTPDQHMAAEDGRNMAE